MFSRQCGVLKTTATFWWPTVTQLHRTSNSLVQFRSSVMCSIQHLAHSAAALFTTRRARELGRLMLYTGDTWDCLGLIRRVRGYGVATDTKPYLSQIFALTNGI